MAKRFFDAMGYRPADQVPINPFEDRAETIKSGTGLYTNPGGAVGYQGKPSSESLGLEELQTCNSEFYAKSSEGAYMYDKQPDWDTVKTKIKNAINARKSVYFDLEYWVTPEYHASTIDVLTQKVFSGAVLSIYTDILKEIGIIGSGVQSLVIRGAYGIPDGDVHPLNPQASIDIWKARVAQQMNGGENSDFIMTNVNCLFPSFYPYDYGNGNMSYSIDLQFQFNKLLLDATKANNKYNYPIYGFLNPRLRNSAGQRPFLDYNTMVTHLNWILSNCDGVVLWDWDGYGYGYQPYGTEIALWDSNAPWFKAFKDVQRSFNTPPVYQTINAQHPNTGIHFR